MTISYSIIHFTDNAEEELALLTQEMRLKRVVESIAPSAPIPEELKADLRQLLLTLHDLFGSSLPAQEDDPLEALRLASRDIHLSKVLRERGLFRVYRALTMRGYLSDDMTGETIEVPGYMTLYNEDSGQNYRTKEEFIGWFCREAKIARSLVFQRLATIEKLSTLGFNLEQSYQLVLAKPSAVQETLEEIADWKKGQLIRVKPGVEVNLAQRLLPERTAEIKQLSLVAANGSQEEQNQARDRMAEVLRPAIANLVVEVAGHPSVRDAMDFVRHDIVARPEIGYRWDYERDELLVELVRKRVDPQGVEYIADILPIRLIADPAMPPEVRRDLLVRLPVKNRESLD
jgi:hypothetical protein